MVKVPKHFTPVYTRKKKKKKKKEAYLYVKINV